MIFFLLSKTRRGKNRPFLPWNDLLKQLLAGLVTFFDGELFDQSGYTIEGLAFFEFSRKAKFASDKLIITAGRFQRPGTRVPDFFYFHSPRPLFLTLISSCSSFLKASFR